MRAFRRDDGHSLTIVPGFRERALGYRPGTSPRTDWSDADYGRAAESKREKGDKRIAEFTAQLGDLAGKRILEVGCGSGFDTVRTSLEPITRVVGMDIHPTLFAHNERGDLARRLMASLLGLLGEGGGLEATLARRPMRFLTGDVRALPFPDQSFDLLWSRSALEHMIPLDEALLEMHRVLAPGGLAYHMIDPYYWLRGCHKRGVVDLPWAHARLRPEEFRRLVLETESEREAAKRSERLATLNPYTCDRYREVLEESPFELVSWEERTSDFAEEALAEHPEVLETLLPGVTRRDVVTSRINVWLRRPA
jgi:ubiquinone/menaquinone biosynthesis C-methylase UbiE